MRRVKTKTGPRRGQALIESCLAIIVLCLVFAGLFQISQLFAAKEILDYSASRGARAKAVGFNEWMVRKVARVAAIPGGAFQEDRCVRLSYAVSDEQLTEALRRMAAFLAALQPVAREASA